MGGVPQNFSCSTPSSPVLAVLRRKHRFDGHYGVKLRRKEDGASKSKVRVKLGSQQKTLES